MNEYITYLKNEEHAVFNEGAVFGAASFTPFSCKYSKPKPLKCNKMHGRFSNKKMKGE